MTLFLVFFFRYNKAVLFSVTLVIFGMPIYAHKKGLHNKFEDNLKLFYMHQMSFIPEFILEIVMPMKNNYINL